VTKIGARAKHSFVGLLLALALAAGLLVSAPPAQAQVGCGDPNVLDLDKTAEPDPVRLGQRLTFTLTETNNSPCPIVVFVEDDLPAGVRLVSATTDEGVCDQSSDEIVCLLFVSGGASATVDIVVVPTELGIITNTASDIFGNQAQATVTVIELTPTPTPNPTPPPSPQPQPAPIQQGGEQEAESGDVDQSFDVVG